jgi:hypothetical protein
MGQGGVACPKGPSRKLLKGRKDRAEAAVEAKVRVECVDRDGFCRFAAVAQYDFLGACVGYSEWAHMHHKRRSKTRGLPPEERHDSAWTFMGCTRHHTAYDRKQFTVKSLTAAGANGDLRVRCGDREAIV